MLSLSSQFNARLRRHATVGAALIISLANLLPARTLEFHVAPGGSDRSPGTRAHEIDLSLFALVQLRRAATSFDVALLDLTMPRLDGEDTLIALRMITPDLPVILTSGYHEQAAAQRFVARGLANFLPKPFLAEALVALVDAALGRPRDTR